MQQFRVLFVEDDPYDVELLVAHLGEAGCQVSWRAVQTAADLEAALSGESYDAVLSDHKMPGFSGMMALEIVRRHYPDLPFLLVTGAIGEEAAVEYMKAGAQDFLLKSSLSRLAPALRREVQEAHNRRRHRESEERYRLIVESTAEGIWILDDELRLTYANKRLGEMLGVAPDQLIGRSILDFLPRAARAEAASRWGEGGVMDVSLVGQQGLAIQALVGSTPTARGLLGMVTDITERRWLEERLLESELEKKAFCREILQAVTRGRLRLVEREEIPDPGQPALEIPLDAWNSYTRLRANLADLAVYEGFTEEGAQDLVLAVGEATTNAIKHARGGLCQAYVAPDRLIVRITDEGAGMAPEDLPRILESNSDRVSLGMGYALILELSDAVWLATGPTGTVVQLECLRSRVVDSPAWSWAPQDLFSLREL